MSERSTEHSTFVVERTYPASPARVFAAWADPAAKARWFYLDGADYPAQRERGTGALLDSLGAELGREPANA